MQGKQGDFGILGAMAPLPPSKSAYEWTSPKGQKLRPKAKNKGGLLGEKPVAGAQSRKQTIFWSGKPPKNAYTEYKSY